MKVTGHPSDGKTRWSASQLVLHRRVISSYGMRIERFRGRGALNERTKANKFDQGVETSFRQFRKYGGSLGWLKPQERTRKGRIYPSMQTACPRCSTIVRSIGAVWEILTPSCPELSGTKWEDKPEFCPILSKVVEPDVVLPGVENRSVILAAIARGKVVKTHI